MYESSAIVLEFYLIIITILAVLKFNIMKKIVLLSFAIIGFVTVNAQETDDNCYKTYFEMFKERGVYPMTDGDYNDIIVTETSPNGTFCYTGRASVKNGRVANMYLKFVDGEYEKISKIFKSDKLPEDIGGVSVPYETIDGVKYTVFFTTKLKPKRQSYMVAPNPADL